MTDATPGQKAMASRIADETIPEDSDAYDTHEARMADWYVASDPPSQPSSKRRNWRQSTPKGCLNMSPLPMSLGIFGTGII